MFGPLTQPEPSERGCHWQLHLWSDNGGAYRVKAGLFRRPSILFRPQTPAMSGEMVEPPGTAPGSEPFITGAFITIVRSKPRTGQDIRGQGPTRKGWPKAKRPQAGLAGVSGSLRCGDQKPVLIISNSSSIFSRMPWSIGVWARRVPSTGLTSAAASSSAVIEVIAASLLWA